MMKLVSILVPAFNAERWIGACLESALAQNWLRKEIIVVDDGSRDATLQIARSYATTNLKVTTQQNQGASAARNRALSLAQGGYIQWLDADDILVPDKVRWQMEVAESGIDSGILLSGSWGGFYHSPGRSRFVPSSLWEDLEPAEWLFRKLNDNLWMAIESWLVSRRLTDMAGPWDESLSLDDDGEYFARVVLCSLGIKFVAKSRSLCRRGVIGLSHDFTLNNLKLNSQAASLFSQIRYLLSLEDSPRTRSACLRLLQRWSIYFYPERPDLYHRVQSTASELGGTVFTPRLRKKYRWLQKLFGWRAAKKAERGFRVLRSLAAGKWEQATDFRSSPPRKSSRRAWVSRFRGLRS